MKKNYFILAVYFSIAIFGCDNNNNTASKPVADPDAVKADSLQNVITDAHNVAMAKWMKIRGLKAQAQRLLDSIERLPAKAREASGPLKAGLQKSLVNMDSAYNQMDRWMGTFESKFEHINIDSTKEGIQKKVRFFMEEEVKIDKVKKAVVESAQHADSLIKSKL